MNDMRIDQDAAFAEVILSPEYRDALNAASLDELHFNDQKIATEQIVLSALATNLQNGELAFEQRRLAALEDLHGENLGAFKGYFLKLGGDSDPTDISVEDVEDGRPETKQTNDRIKQSMALYEDPIDFLDDALEIIGSRSRYDIANVGPENYATAIKFFADKYAAFPSNNLDERKVHDVVSRCMKGFFSISKREEPNFVELTNIFAAIRDLPLDTFDVKFTKPILDKALTHLPTFHNGTLSVLLAATAKMNIEPAPEVAANLVDLTMRKMRSFETTKDMRRALRAVANLERTPAADQAFATFLELRNNLEDPLDLSGLDETAARMLSIVESVIDDPDLAAQAQQVSFKCAVQAVEMHKREERRGAMTPQQLDDMKNVVKRIVSNFKSL